MPARNYDYLVVDVFTETPFEGNPLAVFPDATGLGDAEMQTLARELNLSESSFVFPPERPEATARLRMFTPQVEVPFAGHPTIGTAFALVRLGRIPQGTPGFVLDERIGPVPVRLESSEPFLAWLRTPPIVFGPVFDAAACAAALGLEPSDLLEGAPAQAVSAGNPFLYVALGSEEAVDRAALDARAIERVAPGLGATGVFVFAVRPDGAYSRMFAPMSGVFEDPATGSATGPLAAYLVEYGLCARREGLRLVSEQGVKMRRRSLVHALLHFTGDALDQVEVGGSAVEVIRGSVSLT